MYTFLCSSFERENNWIYLCVPSGNRFAHKNVVKCYCHLLRSYSTNTTLTNHCVIKILHRIAWDCKMPAMMFQLSVFKTFQMIMNDPRAKTDTTIKVRTGLSLLAFIPICASLFGLFVDVYILPRLCFFTYFFLYICFVYFELGIVQVCYLHHEKVCGNGRSQPENLCGTAVLEDRP